MKLGDYLLVSIHAPARGATFLFHYLVHYRHVSIHAPARGATLTQEWRGRAWLFQSTRPHGARLSRALPRCNRPHSFNPRARTGRDADPNHAGTGGMVSIHAPARGATTERTTPMNDIDVFQSTRPHGARRTTVPRPGRRSMFQSTRPHGARRSVRQARSAHWSVSIHAPARGATSLPRSILAQRLVSIHAPARGATVTNWTRASSMPLFQSTRPHGARPCHLTYTYNNANIHPKCDYPA